jgi:hypothetical protein
MSAAEACASLQAGGWRQVGAGDWSWVYADPDDAWAVRVTPFDPGYRMFAEACLAGPANRWLPKVARILPLVRDGYAVLMERLWPADEAAASAFCAALGIANETNHPPPSAGPAVAADAPDLDALRERTLALLAAARARYGRWAVCDIREGNVMADRDGALKLVDPVGVGGWMIAAALREGRADPLADFSVAQLLDFLTIPYFCPGREGLEEKDALASIVARLSLTAPAP